MYDFMVIIFDCMYLEVLLDCGFFDGVVLYFVTYVIVMGYVFINFFVVFILDYVIFGVLCEVVIIILKYFYDF